MAEDAERKVGATVLLKSLLPLLAARTLLECAALMTAANSCLSLLTIVGGA